MNPDIYSAEYAYAAHERDRREMALKVARSRAAQPRRKNTRNIRPNKTR